MEGDADSNSQPMARFKQSSSGKSDHCQPEKIEDEKSTLDFIKLKTYCLTSRVCVFSLCK